MEPKNLKEYIALIERYESITLEEIEEKIRNGFDISEVANALTGFGDARTCTLCTVDGHIIECYDECIYNIKTGSDCNIGINNETYLRIRFAETSLQLYNAFHERVKHMKTLIITES